MANKSINEIVKIHRKAARLSQHQLADLSGVGKTTVFDLEKGKESIQLDTLLKVLRVLNIKLMFSSPYLDMQKGEQ